MYQPTPLGGLRPLLAALLFLALPSSAQTQSVVATPVQATNAEIAPVNQRRVDPASMYHRIYAVVPMVGTGTKGDPMRPMFLPTSAPAAASHSGILAFQMQVSDDGKSALVELVAATRADLLPIISSTAVGVKVFERGKAAQADIEAEFQKYKKNFKMSLFNSRAQ